MNKDKKNNYYDMSDALDELRFDSFTGKEKAIAGLKLFSKGMFNAIKYTATEIVPSVLEQSVKTSFRTSEQLLKRNDLTDEQRRRLEDIRKRSGKIIDQMEAGKIKKEG